MNKIVGFVEIKAEDFQYVDDEGGIHYPEVHRCIALDNVADFCLSIQPNEEEYKILVEQGFVEYEPDDIDGMYHFARKEYLI